MFYHPATQRKIPEGTAFELEGPTGEVNQYPPNWLNLTSEQDKIAHGLFDLVQDERPSFDPITEYCVPGPVTEIEGVWHDTWVVLPLSEETITTNQINAAKAMQAAILQGMTELFDTTTQSRHYDNRITCALRAGYPGPFHDEGVAFATWMDNQNAKAYTLLAQVGAGEMAMPTSVAEALALLDPMVWPT